MIYSYEPTPETEEYQKNNPKDVQHCRGFWRSLSNEQIKEYMDWCKLKPYRMHGCGYCIMKNEKWDKAFNEKFNCKVYE